jgi:hypothetical protein
MITLRNFVKENEEVPVKVCLLREEKPFPFPPFVGLSHVRVWLMLREFPKTKRLRLEVRRKC